VYECWKETEAGSRKPEDRESEGLFMRIVRFLDENDQVCYGHDFREGQATLLKGELLAELQDRGERIFVKKLLAPLQPVAILCIGLNYRQHAAETGTKLPEYPVLFMKNPAAIAHPGDPIILPTVCLNPPQVDYEAELVAVIGKPVRNVSAANALDYVLGYTAANDVSARWWQLNAGASQWIRGKSFDTFCPLGPELITADEVPDPQNLRLRSILNNEVMQDGNTSDMIFPVRELIEFLSQGTTLLPGTVILTGTPSGVGFVRQPPVFLKPGDIVSIELDEVGVLTNPVVKAKP
jgi:2-keto-4-pentenoate hydratase/2-oxohepta-3-ene-1,7-dioic acid hydratase in catechol pathway